MEVGKAGRSTYPELLGPQGCVSRLPHPLESLHPPAPPGGRDAVSGSPSQSGKENVQERLSGEEPTCHVGDAGTWAGSLAREDALQEEMATCSSSLAWETPWLEEPGGRQSVGL